MWPFPSKTRTPFGASQPRPFCEGVELAQARAAFPTLGIEFECSLSTFWTPRYSPVQTTRSKAIWCWFQVRIRVPVPAVVLSSGQ